MFSVQQKRDIANAVQKILRDTGHSELPVGEIQFKLYVHGRFQWSWADIQNNGAVPHPSVNPWNEAQAQNIPAEDRYGREPDKMKPLAQYLMEYIEHETGMDCHYGTWRELLEQALDAYQSTENVTIKIERV